VTWCSYLLFYTPLKTRTSLATVVGAVPGAAPPLLGWTAASGELGLGGWLLFALLFLWQLPHFLAIAWLYREDYARAGMPMLAVQDPGGHAVARQMLAYFGALVPVSTLVAAVSRAGTLTAAVAPVLGLLLVAATLPGVLGRPSRPWARRCFLGSIVYLSLWLLVLVVDAAAPRGALPVLGEAPRFELVDANGAPRTSAELWDRVWVAGFLFTRCTGPCPRLARRMRHLQAVLPERLPVRLVSFSVDPEHDTPAVLAAYARALDADGRRWWFLTGPRDRIRRIAVEGFHLPVAEAASDAQRAAHGPILHSTRLVLVDRRGRVRGYYECEDDGAQAALLRDIRALEAAQP
jgi:cytochrome oxidase Cu insertion factor (SCO1/SenC/PrrC family)